MRPPLETQQMFANTFSSAEGRIVLGWILTEGQVLLPLDPNNVEQIAKYNFAVAIARMAGAFDKVYPYLGIEVSEDGNSQLSRPEPA
jgi:hypothetical protein